MKAHLLALLRALACWGNHRLITEAWWDREDKHWWRTDWRCIDCGHVEPAS